MAEAGLVDLFGKIMVISGTIPIEDMNKMISITGYVGKWYEELLEAEEIPCGSTCASCTPQDCGSIPSNE